MVRVNTTSIGVAKKSTPSRKNGRFSGKNSANRSLTSSCATSASTWEKSGLTVALSVRLEVKPQRVVSPGSTSSSPLSRPPPGNDWISSVRLTVSVGSSSRLFPGSSPWKPVILSI